jgi:hypothetical protein
MFSFMNKFLSFTGSTLKLIITNPRNVDIIDLMRYFPEWWSSFDNNRSPITDERPWIAFAATRFLDSILRRDMKVYEYGSGGSTLFFAARVQEVVSTEHNKDWYLKVTEAIQRKKLSNSSIRLFEPVPGLSVGQDASDPESYCSGDQQYRGLSFREYASSIDSYPEGYFDVVFIDGRARPSCFKHAEKKVKEGGYVILDNAETPYYSFIHDAARDKKWEKRDYFGLFPHLYHFSETCIWQKTSSRSNNP